MNAQIDHLDTQDGAHLQAVRAATSLPAALGEEDTHRDHVAAEFDTIRGALDTLSKCTVRTAIYLDTSGLHAALQDLSAEEDQHRNGMRATTDLAGALELERRHVDAMTRLVAYVRSQRDDLASRAESAECP